MTHTTKVSLWMGGTVDVPSDHPMFMPIEELKAMIKPQSLEHELTEAPRRTGSTLPTPRRSPPP